MQYPSNIPTIERSASPSYQPQVSCRILTYLDIENFKINPCTIKVQHNHKQCQFFHYPKDRKRQGSYSADLCPFVENEEICPYGDACGKSHSRVEQLYSPLKYKTRFCSYYPNNLPCCEYGEFCSFGHNEGEINIPLIHYYDLDEDFFLFHYKTIMCPFNQNKHDKSSCVYAHNWQDFRRKPSEFSYEPIPCPNWKTADFITNYDEACPNGIACNKCHGWKEFDFHPLNYMMKPCPKGKSCNRKKDCTFYHFINEKREIAQNVQFKIFKFVPRNRVIKGQRKSLGEQNTSTSFMTNDNSGVSLNMPQNSNSMNGSWPKVFTANNSFQRNVPTSPSNNQNVLFNYVFDMDGSGNNGNPMNLNEMFQASRNIMSRSGGYNMNYNVGNSNNENGGGSNGIGQKKVSWNNMQKSPEFYPIMNNNGDNLNSFPKPDNWKQQSFLPELIEEKENDENITPRSFKVNLQPKSLPFIENDFDYSHNNLPPPFSLAKRNAAEKSSVRIKFKGKRKMDEEMLKTLAQIEMLSFNKNFEGHK